MANIVGAGGPGGQDQTAELLRLLSFPAPGRRLAHLSTFDPLPITAPAATLARALASLTTATISHQLTSHQLAATLQLVADPGVAPRPLRALTILCPDDPQDDLLTLTSAPALARALAHLEEAALPYLD